MVTEAIRTKTVQMTKYSMSFKEIQLCVPNRLQRALKCQSASCTQDQFTNLTDQFTRFIENI